MRALKTATESANGYSCRACISPAERQSREEKTDQECLARQMEKLEAGGRTAGVRLDEVEHYGVQPSRVDPEQDLIVRDV